MTRRSIVGFTLIVAAASVAALVPLGLLVGASGGSTLTVYSDDAEGADAATRFEVWSNGTGATAGATSWQLVDAATATQTFAGAHSASHFWYAGLQQTPAGVTTVGYLPAADVSIVSPVIDLAASGAYRTAKLTFWDAGQLDATVAGDRFLVQIKNVTDDASQWRTLLTDDVQDVAYVARGLDVTSWIGHAVQVRFRMTTAQASAGLVDGVGLNVDDVAVELGDPLGAPTAPLLLHPTSVTSTGVSLAWSAPADDGGSGILEYSVLRDGAPLASAGTARAYTDATTSPGTAYTYTVTARSALGTSPASASVSVLTVDPTVPDAPTGLTATAGVGSIALGWTAPAHDGGATIASYQIYRDGAAYGTSASRAFLDASPGPGSRTYAVAAVNSVGEGAPSASRAATAIAGMTFKTYTDEANAATRRQGMVPVVKGLVLPAGAGEPSVGVDRVTNDVLIQVDRLTLKLHPDGGAGSWSDVSYPYYSAIPVSDPIGWLDPATNRYFGSTILGPCSQTGFTDDAGATWTATTGSCDSDTGVDHQTIGGGPFPPGLSPATGYPDAVWYCAQFDLGARCAISLDGGLTYLPPEPIYSSVVGLNGQLYCNAIHGHVRVSPLNGSAVVPTRACGGAGARGGSITYDGLTWHTFTVPGSAQRNVGGDFDPSAAFASDGTLYYGSCDGNVPNEAHPRVAVSRDGARSWTAPVDVAAASGIKNCQFAEMIAGDGDRAAMAFLGSTTAGDENAVGFAGVWHMYVASTTDRGATWTLVDTTPADPVQAGCIDAGGTVGQATGAGCNNRNLLDFNDIALDSRGYVVVGYADGCVGACVANPSHAASNSAVAAVAVQTGGPCLYAAKCALPPPNGTSASPPPPLIANADACDPNVVIFSSNSAVGQSVNAHAGVCAVESVAGGGPANTAFVNPASDRVSVRYSVDLGAGTPTLTATLNGLGLADVTVTLTRGAGTTGAFSYNGPSVAIDPAARGSITATVKNGTQILGQATFHTVT